MALGDLIYEETGKVTGIRVLSCDASGTNVEVNLQTSGKIRGVNETCLWTYTQLTRTDGSIYGHGQGVMTTEEGDVIQLIGHGSGKASPPGGTIFFRCMVHYHTTSPKYTDLNSIAGIGEYDVDSDGNAVDKFWEWK